MALRSIVLATIGLMLVLGLFLAWGYPSTQDLLPTNPFWNGLEDFSRKSAAEMSGSPDEQGSLQDSVRIIIPYAPYPDADLAGIKRFVDTGGTAAILDDFGYGNSILEYLGLPVRFSGASLFDPLFNFKDGQLPRITSFEGRLKDKGLSAIVLNRPTVLLGEESASVLASSSENSFLDYNGNGSRDGDEPQGPFPVAAEMAMDEGKVVLVSDASILINGMINMSDNYRFLKETLGIGEKHVIIDASHIPTSTLDRAKVVLARTRTALSGRYIQIAFVSLLLALALRPLWKRRNIEDVNEPGHQIT